MCKKGEKVMMNDLCYGKQIWDYVDVNGLIDEFIELYKNRPIINNRGGCCLRIYFGHGLLSGN